MQIVVSKILLDHITFISATDNKIMDTMSAIGLHDMPENRLASDLDHRFGPEVRLFGDSSAKPAGKNNCFQW